jgi:hypothetical protein
MCIVEISARGNMLRYTFKNWRDAIEFVDDYAPGYASIRIYSV